MAVRTKTGVSILALAAAAALAPIPAGAVVPVGGPVRPAVTVGLHITSKDGASVDAASDLDAPKTPVDHLVRLIDALPVGDVDYEDAVDVRIAQSLYDSLDERERKGVSKNQVDKLGALIKRADELEAAREALKPTPAADAKPQGKVSISKNATVVNVTVKETGTLQRLIESTDGYLQDSVMDVTVVTEPGAFLNTADFAFLRTMLPNLKSLNLKNAACVDDWDPANPIENKLPDSAMQKNVTLQTIVLPDTIEIIGKGAFNECWGLRGDLVIPDSVKKIEKVAFGFWASQYASFDTVRLSSNLETMEAGAFLRCKIKGTITIPKSLRYTYGDGTYGGIFQHSQSSGIIFEEGSQLERIGRLAFCDHPNATGDVIIPETVTVIEGQAFSGCKSLTRVKLPKDLEQLGFSAFSDCSSLTGVIEIPSKIKTIESSTFQRCAGLEGVKFNENLTSIQTAAFQGCTSLKGDLYIPDTVTELGTSAFNGCSGLDGELHMSKNIQVVGTSAFLDNTQLRGEVVFPEIMDAIGSYAFQNCSSLTGLVMPKRLNGAPIGSNGATEYLGVSAFINCSRLQMDGFVFPEGPTEVPLNLFSGATSVSGKLVIPDGVTAVRDSAFFNTGFTSLELGDDIEYIGVNSFSRAKLSKVGEFPVALETLSNNAFAYCEFLTNTGDFPDGLKTIGNNVFTGCKLLEGGYVLPAGLDSFGKNCFNSTKVSTIEYHGNKLTDWGANDYFGNASALETLDLSGSSIEKLVLSSTNAVFSSIELPETVVELTINNRRSLEDIDLIKCSGLTKVNLKGNAIDFSGGKPKEWLDSFNGIKDISDQLINFYAERGKAERSIAVGEEFRDDFKILTKNGTNLSTEAAWTELRSKHQKAVAPAGEDWISQNRMQFAFPVVRKPDYKTGVNTDAEGAQTISYSSSNAGYPELYEKLNYSVTLTVGKDVTPEPPAVATLEVLWENGSSANKKAKTYGDKPFPLKARLTEGATPEQVEWKVYSDEAATLEGDEVLTHDDAGVFTPKNVGDAWVVAAVKVDGQRIESAPTKISVLAKSFNVNLTWARNYLYGNDTEGLGYNKTVTLANGTKEDVDIEMTREPGNDVGKYQAYLYDLKDLGFTQEDAKKPGFWSEYSVKAKELFKEKNPNYSLTFGNTQDSQLPRPGAEGNVTISPMPLSNPSGNLAHKDYDTTTDTTLSTQTPLTGFKYDDLEAGKVKVDIDAQFDSPNVARTSTGSVTQQTGHVTITLTGERAKNYTLPNNYPNGEWKGDYKWTVSDKGLTVVRKNMKANINQLTITTHIKPLDKVYDGTNEVVFKADEMERGILGLCKADQENISSLFARLEDKSVGVDCTATLASRGGKIDLSNYKLPTTLKATVEPKALMVEGLTAQSKVYDGTTDAVLSGTPRFVDGEVIEGDDVTVDTGTIGARDTEFKGSFYDANVGTHKTVVVSTGFGLAGKDAGNYYLRPSDGVQAGITPAPLTVTPDAGQSKSLGAIDPVFQYTTEGQVPADSNEDGSIKSGIIRGDLGREPGEAVGTYAYTLGSLTSNSNYELSLVEGDAAFAIRDTNAKLVELKTSNGILNPVFAPEVGEYTVHLPLGTTAVPQITAKAESADAAVSVMPAEDLSGSTTIEVTAADGESRRVYTVSFKVNDAVKVEAMPVDASGADKADGIIVVTATGGYGVFEYSLDGETWQASGAMRDLKPDDYTVYVRDVRDHANATRTTVTVGAKGSGGAEVVAPNPPTSLKVAEGSSTLMPYSAQAHAIELVASGADEGAEYFYHLDELAGEQNNADVNGNVLTALDAGAYKVCAHAVKGGVSSVGCPLTVEVTRAEKVSATAEVTDCKVWGGNGGSVTVNAAGGLGSYEHRIGEGEWQSGATFDHLEAGTYAIEVRDAADVANVTSVQVTVEQPDATDAAAVIAVRDMLEQGEISLGDLSAVTENLLLPTSVQYGRREVSVSWRSSDESVLWNDGMVKRPAHVDESGKLGKDAKLELTATVSVGDVSRAVSFDVTVLKEDHSFGTDWIFDDKAHWHVCECDAKADEASHTFDAWVVTKDASETEPGTQERTCSECGYKETEEIPPHKHEHVFAGRWMGNENSHWRECFCGERENVGGHEFPEWNVVKAASHVEEGLAERTCTVCGRTETKVLPVTPHEFGADWAVGESSHWHECECGAKADEAAHLYGDWTVVKEPLENESGIKKRTCVECGHDQTATISPSPHEHVYDGKWKTDDFGHWRECVCGETTEVVPHGYGDWVVVEPVGCETAGKRERTCVACGHVQAEVIPATGHSYGVEWVHDGSSHWRECECGEKSNVVKHVFDEWVVTRPATHAQAGERMRVCPICGFAETEEIPVLPEHEFDENVWLFDKTGHWHVCDCGEKVAFEEHVFADAVEVTGQRTCEVCGYSEAAEAPGPGPEHKHSFGEWIVTKEPTATDSGEERRVCSECGKVETREIPVLGDTEEPEQPKVPSLPVGSDGNGDKSSHEGLPSTGDAGLIVSMGAALAGISATIAGFIARRRDN